MIKPPDESIGKPEAEIKILKGCANQTPYEGCQACGLVKQTVDIILAHIDHMEAINKELVEAAEELIQHRGEGSLDCLSLSSCEALDILDEKSRKAKEATK